MSELREYSYKIIGLKNLKDVDIAKFKDEFSNISGVIAFNVKKEEELVEYALDQWSSDYDAFSKLSEICENYNIELVFEEDEIVETEVIDEITPTDEEKFDEEETPIKNKLTKGDFIEKIILSCLSLALLAVGLFIDSLSSARQWILLLAFTVASYEVLYEVVVKATEKKFVLEEILTFVGALILTYLGYNVIATIIMLIYSALMFFVAFAKHKIATKKEQLINAIDTCEDEKLKSSLKEKLVYFETNENVSSAKTLGLYSKRLNLNLAFIAVAVLAVFIPPFFTIKTYWSTLVNTWLYLGAGILLLSGFSEVLFSISHTESLALLNANEKDVEINSINAFFDLANKESVVFDKTGVITTSPKVESVEGEEKTLLYAFSALQTVDNHISKAVKRYAKGISPLSVDNFSVTANMGVKCKILGDEVLVGNKRFLKDNSIVIDEINDNRSHLYVCKNSLLIGYLVLAFEVYDNSYGAIAEIKNDLQLKTELLSCDDSLVVSALKKDLSFDKAVSGASARYKADKVNKENSIYVGHESFDSETLSLVDNSITFGKAGKIAVKTKEIRKVPFIIKLAKRTVNTVNFNKKFAICTKIGLIALAIILRAVTSINFIWWLFALDVVARIFTIIRAMLNSSEVA